MTNPAPKKNCPLTSTMIGMIASPESFLSLGNVRTARSIGITNINAKIMTVTATLRSSRNLPARPK